MNKLFLVSIVASSFATGVLARNVKGHAPVQTVLGMHTMYGVDGALVGDTNPIRGIPGDELPWEIGKSTNGELQSNGRLRLHVHGLVFADDPSVPPELRGTNDETTFRAVVSCLTLDAGGLLVTENLTTDGFRANSRGDSEIDAALELPSPCIAPIVFVIAGSEDKWFAVTGVETEED